MADYDSDSSFADDIETNVLLGYASREPTADDFSQLGGHPRWFDDLNTPPGALSKCGICNGYMSLLLQLNADLPEKFPGHERRLYILACRRKPCRRKAGSVKGFRASKQSSISTTEPPRDATTSIPEPESQVKPQPSTQPPTNLGESLFGVKSSSSSSSPKQGNPFATSSSSSINPPSNPFAGTSSLAAKPPQRPDPTTTLSETFAQKAKLTPSSAPATQPPTAPEPWPSTQSFPPPFPQYSIDAEKEYIEAEDPTIPSGVRMDTSNGGENDSSSNAADDKAAFESSMDKTFQRFADRLAQNAEQVVRYEFAGQPLLYSRSDAVGKLLAPSGQEEGSGANVRVKTVKAAAGSTERLRVPRCGNCGGERVFELQLTPHAIVELEVEDMSVDGMEWGTIIMAVCARDCMERGKGAGGVGYVEEWIGVQWEEVANNPVPS